MKVPEFKDVASASQQVATHSAMNPILWKTVICVPVGIVCSVLASPPLSYMLFGLSCFPVVVGCWGFMHFAKTDPRRLQSEGHLEHMEVLGRLGSNTTGQEILISPDSALKQRQIAADGEEA